MYVFHPKPLENFSHWAFYEKAFTKIECMMIRALFEIGAAKEAQIGNESINPNVRKTKIQWIQPDDSTRWIFDRLSNYVRDCNSHRYGFQLSGFYEPLQLTYYSCGDMYHWHQDSGGDKYSTRKLSVVIQLSDPEEYEGGALEFLGFESEKVPTEQGTVIIFPAFNPHRVTEVTKGERFSLVAWTTGEPFK